jgi:hypothetical protein
LYGKIIRGKIILIYSKNKSISKVETGKIIGDTLQVSNLEKKNLVTESTERKLTTQQGRRSVRALRKGLPLLQGSMNT